MKLTLGGQAREQMEHKAAKKVLLEVKNLKKYYPIRGGFLRRHLSDVKAVDDISFVIHQGETLGLVGESGCGKSTTGRTILRLQEPTAGSIHFMDEAITHIRGKHLRQVRKEMQMVFQDPYASLNPKMMVGNIVSEPLRNFYTIEKNEMKEQVMELLRKVGLSPETYYKYPHQFSGGQRQRVGIARALALRPKLIVADEPVSALDVSIQSQVLNLLKELQVEFGLTYLFIAHDLSVVEHMSDRIGVMYLGRMMELADNDQLYREPLHPYTQALLSAIPIPEPGRKRERIVLTGDVPSPADPPRGCVFHPRCVQAMAECKIVRPRLKEVKPGQLVACHLYG